MYKISYLPIALEDLKGIVRYIAHTLEAPRAAANLVQKIDRELIKISDNPFRCHVYSPLSILKYEYRVLNVNNYSLFYVIEKEKVEIHRVLHSKMNIKERLEGSVD